MRKKLIRIKSFIALGLVSMMVFGCGNTENDKKTEAVKTESNGSDVSATDAAQPAPSQYPDYLNLESARPIVKEGEEITLKLLVKRESIANSNVNENWFARFIEEKLNINLEIEEVTATTYEERRNLVLASNDLPDIMINMGLTANDIVTYGVDGGQLLPMSDYVNEELTPNIVEILNGQEAAVVENTAPDGKMYTLPSLFANNPGWGNTVGVQRIFIDTKYMEAAGVEKVPETLDEFVDMLRAFKGLDPAQMGVKEIFPIVSTWGNDLEYLQNAFGWMTTEVTRKKLVNPLWDVETNSVEVPVAQEKYGEYIKVLNTMYTEGLIHPDFFTIDKTTARGLYSSGAVPVLADSSPISSLPDRLEEFVSAIPASSKWNEKGVTSSGKSYSLGSAQISADTKYPEVCMRLLDYLYSPEGSVYSDRGCPSDSEDTMGLIGGFYLKDDGETGFIDVDNGKFESQFEYTVNSVAISQNTPRVDTYTILHAQKMLGVESPEYGKLDFTRQIVHDAHKGRLVDSLPAMYMGVEETARWTDLKSVIQSFVDAETAKFVVGQRPLSELNQYFEELKELGIDEFVEISKAAYKDYKGPQQ